MSTLFEPLLFGDIGKNSQKLLENPINANYIKLHLKPTANSSLKLNTGLSFLEFPQKTSIWSTITTGYTFQDFVAIQATFSTPKQAIININFPKLRPLFANAGLIAQLDPQKIYGYGLYKNKYLSSSLTADLLSKEFRISGATSLKGLSMGILCNGNLNTLDFQILETRTQYSFTVPTLQQKFSFNQKYKFQKSKLICDLYSQITPQLSLTLQASKCFNQTNKKRISKIGRLAIGAQYINNHSPLNYRVNAKLDSDTNSTTSIATRVFKNMWFSIILKSHLSSFSNFKSYNLSFGVDIYNGEDSNKTK
ncbi:hypothetical protein M0813_06701 [Anaeramoeba flamelloides]|uniref:Uncharacterized protein n=1 Tax=Anaeramoeba flamelloides TaxID=1746091 RepID=A0ABQ8XCU4_9EUKA|nr:hypothetical protein M0813_06701 [Anaeramoeba flamelloides]